MSDQADLLISSRMASPEEIETARLARNAVASARPPQALPLTGHTLVVEVRGAGVVGDEIHMTVKITGQVSRPDMVAIPTVALVMLKIPADVASRGEVQ